METAQGNYIFIGYSRKDSAKVIPIVDEMQDSGYNVWYDKKIPVGKNWLNSLASHIKRCTVFVAFHSQTSRDSQRCQEEIHYALKKEKPVLSVYLEDVTLEDGLDMQLARFNSVTYAEPAELLEALRKSPDFARCAGNVLAAPKKRKGVNVKKIGGTLKKGAQFVFKAVSFLVAVSLSLAILALLGHYVKRTPIWFFDKKSGVLDIISPPFLEVNMTSYDYDSGINFRPPPWAAETFHIQCAVIRKCVTGIGSSSFQNCSNMEFVFIPESVTHIDSYAFSGCTALKEIQFPSGLELLGSNAFEGCIGLEEITIPSSIVSIFPNAFLGCSNLKIVRIQSASEKVYIEANAFAPGTKIIFEPPNAGADVVEYVWGSD